MPESGLHTAARLIGGEASASAWSAALAGTYKALKAFSFYPEGHPLREKILLGAYKAMAEAAKEGPVSLIVHRNGFSFAGPKKAIAATPLTKELAQELFAREIQRLMVLPELSQAEFTQFLTLLAIDPPKVIAAGGLSSMLKQQGTQAIILNEIDISAVFTRRKAEQTPEEAAAQGFGSQAGSGEGSAQSEASSLLDHLSNMSVEELIVLMSMEKDDNQYRQLARLLLSKGLPLKQEKEFDRLSGVLAGMAEQSRDPNRSAAGREQARMVLQQLGPGEMTEHLLDHLEEAEFRKVEMVYAILKALGGEVVDAVIKRLIAAGFKSSRKTLTNALLRIGPEAEPALCGLLQDARWQVVLAAVAILAELGSRDAVQGLVLTAYHPDGRVRMESIRALAGIGGIEASAALVELLRDQNQAIGIHAITWLGNTRNQRALPPLLQLVLNRDLLGKTQALKKEALIAIGRIGDRRALEPLFRLVRKSFWLFPGRWDELKILAVEAIGNLGGESARKYLKSVSALGGHLGRVSAAALESMDKRNPDQNE